MVDLPPLPDLPQHPVPLRYDPEDYRGNDDPGPPEPLDGRVLLGGPLAERIDDTYLAGDPELKAYLASQAHYRFVLVRSTLTFSTADGQPPFAKATVQFALAATPPGGRDAPVALSMAPTWVAGQSRAATAWKLSPQLKFAGVEGSLGEVGQTTQAGASIPALESGGLLSDAPKWMLTGSRDAPLEGHQPVLQLVLRLPAAAPTRLRTQVWAWVKKSGLRRFSSGGDELRPGILEIDLP